VDIVKELLEYFPTPLFPVEFSLLNQFLRDLEDFIQANARGDLFQLSCLCLEP
jgi:hypothetical protein